MLSWFRCCSIVGRRRARCTAARVLKNVTIQLKHVPGELARVADGGVRVDAIYVVSTPSDVLELAVVTDHADRAASVLERSVFAPR